MFENNWEWLLFFYTMTALMLLMHLYFKRKNIFSYFNFFVLWFWVIMISGIGITYLLKIYFDFDRLSLYYINYGFALSLLFIFIFLLTYKILPKFKYIAIFPKVTSLFELKVFGYLLLFASLLALTFFLSKYGFLILHSGSYEERYSTNLGYGIITRLFPMYTAGLLILFLIKPNKKKWLSFIFIGTVIGLLIFAVMGGYRQIVAIHIFIFLILGFHHGYIRLRTLIIMGIIAVPVLMLMALMRYNISNNQIWFNFLIFTLDSFSPYDSFGKIIEYYSTNNYDFQGISIVLNEFSSLIPRAIWMDKPSLVLNAGNFYTINILEYNAQVTMSPTLLGSLYIIGGELSIILNAVIIAIFIKYFDSYFYRRINYISHNEYDDIVIKVFYYMTIFYVVTIAREGFEVFLQRTFMMFVLFIFFMILSKLYVSLNKTLK